MAGLGEELVLTFADPNAVNSLAEDKEDKSKPGKAIELYLDQTPMGLEPTGDWKGKTLTFLLRRTTENAAVWNMLYKKAAAGSADFTVAVGAKGDPSGRIKPQPETMRLRPPEEVRVGGELVLEFESLKSVLALLNDKKGKPRPDTHLTLFLDGHPMGIQPVIWDWKYQRLRFVLEPTDSNAPHWRALFSALSRDGLPVPVAVGVAGEEQDALSPKNSMAILRLYASWPWVVFAIGLILAMAGGLIAFAMKSNMLRESVTQPAGTAAAKPPFSLGRVQMALWLFVITSAYFFLWLVFGDKDNLNATALTLLGISAGTGVAARTISAAKNGGARNSDGFWKDILSDESGVSLSRFQMAAWTFVLLVIFVVELWRTKVMPTFSDTLLGLLGISAGAYLGFKFPEKPSD